MASQSTQFEMSVYDILRASGFRVLHNVDIDGQQVDVLAQQRFMGTTQRIAVECKDHADPFGLNDVSLVYAKYHALIEAGHVDRVLLVTRNDMTSKAKAYVRRLRREFHHQTLEQLIDSAMQFDDYVHGLISSFQSSEEAGYFTPPRARAIREAGRPIDLATEMTQWCADEQGRPIALVSGYGMRKTTFLRYLAAELGKRWVEDKSQRIPVLIDLGTISDEQSLEGLIAKALTVGDNVHNYSFSHFMRLNARGRLVILMDAFDEMKHGISWSGFFHNMGEIRRLHCDRSRLLIAGRPTIFQSEAEMRELLDGAGTAAAVSGVPAGFPGFRELHLEPWTAKTIEEFLSRYTESQVSAGRLPGGALARTKSRLAEDKTGRLLDLASRPIQLKMIAIVLPEWKEKLDNLSEALLYGEFIDVLLKREVAKPTRTGIGTRTRRRFARELAWLLWHGRGKRVVRFCDLGDEIVAKATGRTPGMRDELLRELVVGSLVEHKPPDILFFPHRSLQEYLVAEYAADSLRDGVLSFDYLETVLRAGELRNFISQLVGRKDLKGSMPRLLAQRGELPGVVEDLFLAAMDDLRDLLRKGVNSPWPALFCLKHGGWPYPPSQEHTWMAGRRSRMQTIKATPEERMKASDIGCMISSANTVATACALHKLLAEYFSTPRADFDESQKGVVCSSSTLNEFFDALQLMLGHKSWKDLPRGSKEAVSEILTGIAVYRRTGSLQFGAARKALVRIYARESSLVGLVNRGKTAHPFDISSNMMVQDPEDLERWVRVRKKILSARP